MTPFRSEECHVGGQVTHIAVVISPQDPGADLAPGVSSGDIG